MKKSIIAAVLLTLALTACGRTHYEYFVGTQGPKGDQGESGTGCTVVAIESSVEYPTGGAVVTCASSTAVLRNGMDGEVGSAGQDAIVALIDPCGDAANIHDEVIIKLSTGVLLSSFSDNENGKNTRFAVLIPGSGYKTTDGSNCTFTVGSDGAVSWQ